jgi:glycosyltransferase involved in cell wall biosynthesis
MNVGVVSYSVYDFDNRVMRYAETLAARGDSVDVIALRRKGDCRVQVVKGVNVFRIQERLLPESGQLRYILRVLLFFLRATLLLSRKQLSRRYQLVHVHSVPDCMVFAAWLPKLMGSKIILDIHDILPEFYASKFKTGPNSFVFKLLLLVERLSAAFADHVIVANHLWQDKLVSRSVPATKCTAILNFPDRSIFSCRGRTRNDGKFVMIYPGTLNSHQGVDTAIRALSLIKDEASWAEFHIYGSGRTKDALAELTHNLALDGRVFFHDPLPLREIPQVMENADLGVVPKRSDTFGNEAFSTKILEFMALRVPVLVANTKVDRYYFDSSLVAFFQSNDERNLARCMLELIGDRQRRERLTRNAWEFVCRNDWGTNEKKYLELISSLLAGRRRSADTQYAVVQSVGSATSSRISRTVNIPHLETSVRPETSAAVVHDHIALGPRRQDVAMEVVLGAIVCAALALRLPFLGQKSLWIDEMWSIGIARMSWASFWSVVRNLDPNMSLYYALLHVWMKLGSSEFVVRLLSVLCGVATVPAVFALGNRLFGRAAGLIASALLAINTFHIQWSQEARGYSLVVLLVTLSSLQFVKSIEEGGRWNWLAYIATSVLAVYAHLFGVLVLAAQWVSLLFRPYRETPWKDLLTSTATIGVLSTPLLGLTLQRSQHTAVPFSWVPSPTLHGIYDVFYTLSGNAEFAGSEGGKSIFLAYLLACFAAVGWWASTWKNRKSPEFWRIALLLCWLFIPLGLVLLISLRQPMFLNRYLLICVPAMALLAAAGVSALKLRSLMSAALLLIAGLSASGLAQYYHFRGHRQEWKLATDHILTQACPGDTAIFYVAPGRLLFDYYRERYHPSSPRLLDISFPEFADEKNNPAALDYSPPISNEVLEASARRPRVWLILYHDQWSFTSEFSQQLKARLAKDHSDVQERKFEGVTLILYSRLPDRQSASGTLVRAGTPVVRP